MSEEVGERTRSETPPEARWRRRPGRTAALAVVALFALAVAAFGLDRLRHRDRVLGGVVVADTKLSGLSHDAAERALRELGARLAELPLSVRVGNASHDVAPSALGLDLDVGATLARAFAAGREGSIISRFGFSLAHLRRPQKLRARVEMDPTRALARLAEWEAAGVKRPFSGGIRVQGGVVRPDPPRRGQLVDRERALEAVAETFASLERSPVELPLVEREPFSVPGAVEAAVERAKRLLSGPVTLLGEGDESLVLSAADLGRALKSRQPREEVPEIELYFDPAEVDALLAEPRKKLEAPPIDARFAVDAADHVSILPSRAGTLLKASAVAEALLQAAVAPARIGRLPMVRGAPPAVSTHDLEALRVTKLVGKYTTFHACCQPRVDNIHHIADMLDGHVVEPGETFSVNEFIGPRTTKSGFKEAPTIEEGEMVDALGGGISQFATTLFNALFLGGYDIVERGPHTYYFSRYPMGRDATLSWPHPDIVFKNDTEAGALIKTQYTDKSITVKMFGDNGGRKVSFVVSPQQDLKKPPIEYIPDITQPPERDKIKQGGQIGWTVFVTRTVQFPDGTKKEEKRKVTYKPRVRRLIVHPCKVPEGEPGYTGEKCPEPDGGVDGGT
jgi:vancomycin resistance protein YoaR